MAQSSKPYVRSSTLIAGNLETVWFTVGQRVKAHPATDTFMRGDVYGTIAKLGTRLVHVKMDTSGRTIKFSAHNLENAT